MAIDSKIELVWDKTYTGIFVFYRILQKCWKLCHDKARNWFLFGLHLKLDQIVRVVIKILDGIRVVLPKLQFEIQQLKIVYWVIADQNIWFDCVLKI